MQFNNFHMGKMSEFIPPSRTPAMEVAECVPSCDRCLLDLFSNNFLMRKLANGHLSQLGIYRKGVGEGVGRENRVEKTSSCLLYGY